MQFPTVEQNSNLRPAGAELVVPAAAKVIPVAPVNPVAAPPSASVVNDINPELLAKAAAESATQQPSASDPLQGGARADDSIKGWTEAAPKPQEVEEPAKQPITQMLIEHVQTLWMLSAKVVELYNTQQARNQDPNQLQQMAQQRNQDPSAIPGVLAKEVLTYSPSRINKTGKPD